MELTVGAILEGKVKSITNFGAFISLPEGKTGMVHISEIAHTYVSDIRQHLTEGQDVKVMVLSIDGPKINLSIKKTEAPPQNNRPNFDRPNRAPRPAQPYGNRPQEQSPRPQAPRQQAYAPRPSVPKDLTFEDKLKQFMSESDSKLSTLKQYSDHKTKTRRR